MLKNHRTYILLSLTALSTIGAMLWWLSPSTPSPAKHISQPTAVPKSAETKLPTLEILTENSLFSTKTQDSEEYYEETSEDVIWLSPPINTLSNTLSEFIETEQLGYVSTEDVPFNEKQRDMLTKLAKSGTVVMFDNTESDYLNSYGLSEGQVVAEFFGTASEGDIIIAKGIAKPQGGIHYLVLPLQKKDGQSDQQWLDDIQSAVTLLKEQQVEEL